MGGVVGGPVSRRWTGLLAVVVAAGCGPEARREAPAECPTIDGDFSALYTLLDTQGDCRAAKSTSSDPMKFQNGVYVAPVEGVVKCSTSQVGCEVTVACTTQVVKARLDFTGALSLDGAQLSGTAVLKGNYRGCTRVSYRVDAVRAAPPDAADPPPAE